jgi:hypothetical protein
MLVHPPISRGFLHQPLSETCRSSGANDNGYARTHARMDIAKVLLEQSRKCHALARACQDDEIARQAVEIANTLMEAAHELSELTEKNRPPSVP